MRLAACLQSSRGDTDVVTNTADLPRIDDEHTTTIRVDDPGRTAAGVQSLSAQSPPNSFVDRSLSQQEPRFSVVAAAVGESAPGPLLALGVATAICALLHLVSALIWRLAFRSRGIQALRREDSPVPPDQGMGRHPRAGTELDPVIPGPHPHLGPRLRRFTSASRRLTPPPLRSAAVGRRLLGSTSASRRWQRSAIQRQPPRELAPKSPSPLSSQLDHYSYRGSSHTQHRFPAAALCRRAPTPMTTLGTADEACAGDRG